MASIESQILVQKLDAFIRKYYKNRMLRGALYAIGLVISLYLLIVFFEYIGRFSSGVRAVLFFSSAAAILGLVF
jgi:hypothetical protein